MGACYLDSSVLIAWLLKEPNQLHEPEAFGPFVSSELIRLECARVICRHQSENRLTRESANALFDLADVWLSQVEILPMFQAVLVRAAGVFPAMVGSLDAIHLATALLWQEDTGERLTFLTHDRQLRTAAQACGFSTSTP